MFSLSRVSALEAESSALFRLLCSFDNCPSLTGLCSVLLPQACQLWLEVKVLHKANQLAQECLYMACASVWNPKQSLLQFLPLWKLLLCGQSSRAELSPPQSRVVPDLQFSCPGSQGRADQTSKPPQGTAHCTAPHGLPSCSFLRPPTPSSSRDSGFYLNFGRNPAGWAATPPDRSARRGEVRSREETCTHGGGTGVRVWS